MIPSVFTDSRTGSRHGVGLPCETEKVELAVTVVFTTPRYTLLALRRAAILAEGLNCSIRILVPEVIPSSLPLSSPPVCRDFRTAQLRTLASRSSVATGIQIVLCRDPLVGLEQSLKTECPVLIGGRKSWWPTKEQRLANALTRLGHSVILVSG